MTYKIELSRSAERTYGWLLHADRRTWERIREGLKALADDPRIGKPLKHRLKGERSLRVGSYRILYRVMDDRLIVHVVDIGHRREVYRRASGTA